MADPGLGRPLGDSMAERHDQPLETGRQRWQAEAAQPPGDPRRAEDFASTTEFPAAEDPKEKDRDKGTGVADAAELGCCLAEASFGGFDCFVATAALGTDRHADLDSLRAFRDRVLSRSAGGVLFVRLYYRWGAVAARMIRGRPVACFIVREGLVRPAARIARRILGG